MEYPQGSFQDMIEKYNRELLEAYRQRQRQEEASPVTAETPAESAAVSAATTVLPVAEEFSAESVVPPSVPAVPPPEPTVPPVEDTRPLYPLYESPVVAAVTPASDPVVSPSPEVGYLQVWVTTATSALPIEGAHVTVTQSGTTAERGEVQFVGVTDKSGRTPAVPLAAVSPQLSLTPNGAAAPYTLYDIEVHADGFYRVKNVGLPLYGGVRAVQPIRLIPLPEYAADSDTVTFQDSAPTGLSGEEGAN